MLVCNVQDLFFSRHASVNCGFKPFEKMEMVELGGLHTSRKEHVEKIYWPKSEQNNQIQNHKSKGKNKIK